MNEQLDLFHLLPAPEDAPRHPQHIILAGRLIGYHLRRDRRRLAMRIDERGLAVGAPRTLALGAIEDFIRQHAAWVLGKLDEFVSVHAPRHLAIRDGTTLPVLDRTATVRVTAGNNRGYWHDDELWLAARPAADLTLLARRALQRRALEYFRPRLAGTVAQLGCPMPALALSAARTRWGSCSPTSGIRLNWRLVHLPPALVDYVVVHEAAHLIEMNHGPRFWKLVEQLCPDWRSARQELKRRGSSLPLI